MVEQIRRAYRKSGLTLTDLEQTSGVSTAQLSRFFRSRSDLYLSVGLRIAEALGLELVQTRPPKAPPPKRLRGRPPKLKGK
jgi:transcriptional regulator with XRE-family HTH domain